MSVTSRLFRVALPVVVVLATAPAAPPAQASNHSTCDRSLNVCNVTGNLGVLVTRSTPCSNFGGSVCYILNWWPQVTATGLLSGNYTATTRINANGNQRTCFFLSPPVFGCSAVDGPANNYIDIVPPNTTTCRTWNSWLWNAGVEVDDHDGERCVRVFS